MIYFDSDMSKSTNTVVYFDWKMVIYIYACGKCRTQFTPPMEKSVTFTGACANEIISSINRSFVYKAKEGGRVRIVDNECSTVNMCSPARPSDEPLQFTCIYTQISLLGEGVRGGGFQLILIYTFIYHGGKY